jgi:UPF0755 protein
MSRGRRLTEPGTPPEAQDAPEHSQEAPGPEAEALAPAFDAGDLVDPQGAALVPYGPAATGDEPEALHEDDPMALEAAPRTRRVAVRRKRKRVRRRRILVGAAALLAVVVGFVAWYEIESRPLGAAGPRVTIHVTPGESDSAIVNTLVAHGVLPDWQSFDVFEFFHGTPVVIPGYYSIRQNQSFAAVNAELAAGPNIQPVHVRPGYTMAEIASAVGTAHGHTIASFTQALKSGAVTSPWDPPGSTQLEGLVGIGTYLVTPGESDTALLAQMVHRFDQQAAQAGLTPAAATKLGLSPYQLVVAASIVEKEGYIAKNMGPVARVIYNRLNLNMPLQMDSTVLYSLGQDGGTVTKADLALNTPYNTYLHSGLTPTPICAPSVTAMRAAVAPPAGAWLYFTLVSKDGTMAFSDTYAEQLQNEALAASRGLP